MFHYGYFVYSAAVIASLDPSWLTASNNKAWVNALVRDYANPVDNDPYFPFSRSFDFYHGHSWAKGLFESGDGKGEHDILHAGFKDANCPFRLGEQQRRYVCKLRPQDVGEGNGRFQHGSQR